MNATTEVAAATDVRQNKLTDTGPFKLGSEAHKRLFCRTLLDTFDPYQPGVADWPPLDPDIKARLTALPIWDMAVQTEDLAMRRVKAFADRADDPLVKEAIELDAFEEGRHRAVLDTLAQAYGLRLQPGRPWRDPVDPEWAFMVTGLGECIDSFFAFGLFEAARCSGYFPAPLIDPFERVIAEEGRHILFFVNWLAWRRRTLPWWRRPLFELKVWGVWIVLALERMSLAAGFDAAPVEESTFTITAAQEFGNGLGVAELMDICLAENERRLGKYDPRLVRPTFVPRMVRLARRFYLRRASAPPPAGGTEAAAGGRVGVGWAAVEVAASEGAPAATGAGTARPGKTSSSGRVSGST